MSLVSIHHCDTEASIVSALAKVVGDLGEARIEALLRGKRVLLKPNLCIDHPPERGATTHPAVLDAVLCLAREYGAEAIVGDGSAVGVRGDILGRTGIGEVCKRHGALFVDFNRGEGRKVRLPDALVLGETSIAETFFEVDAIINLPVFKSNMLCWVSGALKNMKGLMVGLEKHKPHYLGIAEAVVDLNRMLKQDLVIMDGFVGMTGNGPAAGRPADARLLIGGFDPVAVDALAARLMGFDPRGVPMIALAEVAGLGCASFELRGDPIESFRLRLTKPAAARGGPAYSILGAIQKTVFRKFGELSRIAVDEASCTLCGRCVEMCPFHALYIGERRVRVDRTLCQYCLCCTEVCAPQAITLKGMLLRKGAALRGIGRR